MKMQSQQSDPSATDLIERSYAPNIARQLEALTILLGPQEAQDAEEVQDSCTVAGTNSVDNRGDACEGKKMSYPHERTTNRSHSSAQKPVSD